MTWPPPPGRPARVAAALATLATLAPAARAEVDLAWRGQLSSDLRLSADDQLTFERSETTARAQLSAYLSDHVNAVGDVSFIFTEASAPRTFSGLTDRTLIDPYRWESDALFIELLDLGLDGLDVRLGRQALIWGAADRFHPVSNLNPLDLEDPILFGKVIANEMVTASYRPDLALGGEDDGEPWLDELSLQLAFVPWFKPAQLPQSAGLAFTETSVFYHRANTALTRDLVAKIRVLERDVGWGFDFEPRVALPEAKLDNAMLGARLGARVLGVDLGLTYFRGFDDVPRVTKIVADTDRAPHIDIALQLEYPRVQVLGFDLATSLDFLDGVGLWAEVGLTLHDALYRVLTTGAIGVDAVEAEHDAGSFVKAVVGADYTPWPWLYLNVQYLHGFIDEFGARELDDYLVAGGDIKLAHDQVLIRFFNVFNLQDGSFVLYPQLSVKPWQGGELILGTFIYSSALTGFDEANKFDSRAAGQTSVFVQARARL
ncbi:MAG: hypothetical protein CSA66_04795 [Proteobacteria bacterium]|nr:MAG: hypothetical protein CSA66_04795 [Pseudomonadota bacterium]